MIIYYAVTVLLLSVNCKELFEDKCRAHGGLWACSDCDECTSIEDCSVEEAAYRAGYKCHQWPWFNRVVPPSSQMYLPVESKQIECHTGNHSTCTVWEEKKQASTALAATRCECSDYKYVAGVRDYCNAWLCEGQSVTPCSGSSTNCGTVNTMGTDTSYYADCCYTQCHEESTTHNGHTVYNQVCTDHQDAKKVSNEYQECVCTEVKTTDTNIEMCEEWECIDFSRAVRHAGSYGYYEQETHQCMERDSSGYCQKWVWQTDDYGSFENTECQCTEEGTDSGDKYCKFYECLEKGAAKVFPELGWMGFGIPFHCIFLGVIYFTITAHGYQTDHLYFYGAIVVLYINLTIIIPLLLGGLGTFFIQTMVNIGITGAFLYVYWEDLKKGMLTDHKVAKVVPTNVPEDRYEGQEEQQEQMQVQQEQLQMQQEQLKMQQDQLQMQQDQLQMQPMQQVQMPMQPVQMPMQPVQMPMQQMQPGYIPMQQGQMQMQPGQMQMQMQPGQMQMPM